MDAAAAGVGDVDGVDEGVLARLGDLGLALIEGAGERQRRRLGRERRLEQDQLVEGDGFAKLHRVFDGHRRQMLRLQPDAGERVAFGEGDDGLEPRLLQRGREEECGVETGG